MPLAQRYRSLLLVVLFSSLLSLYYLHSQHQPHINASDLPQPVPDPVSQVVIRPEDYPPTPPKIQLIAIWSPTDVPPIYLPNFFASVAANPSIDLLFIKYDRYKRGAGECEKHRATGIPNVRELCLSVDDVWHLHANFFCERWNCNSEQRKQVLETLLKRSGRDRVNSYYRPFRSAIFKKWIHPDTTLWGWCDLDTILGNFDRAFPWDISTRFDVYISGWSSGPDVLMFMPGHLTVFRNSDDVVNQFMAFPNLKDVNSYLAEPWIDEASEESSYSHFLFVQSNLTFVRFDAMVQGDYHISSPGLGVYHIDDVWRFNLSDQSPLHIHDVVNARETINDVLKRHHQVDGNAWNSFSPDGEEHAVKLRIGEYKGVLWFPKPLAVHYDTAWTNKFWQGRRLIYRQVPRGEVIERVIPGHTINIPPHGTSLDADVAQSSKRQYPFLRERLYNHLQHEKYTKWWSLPPRPIKKGEVLFVHKNEGAMLWDENGVIQWRSKNWEV